MNRGLTTIALVLASCRAEVAPPPAAIAQLDDSAAPPERARPAVDADWDAEPDAAAWTELTGRAIDEVGGALIAAEPRDVAQFCPGYASLDADGRRAFWIGLISAMARLESDFDPSVAFDERAHCSYPGCEGDFTTQDGRAVVSRGLLQLSQESANAYRNCSVPPERELELHEPGLNLRCAVVILARWVEGDGQIGDSERPYRGGARYWSVLRRPANLEAIRRFTASTSICSAS